MGHLQGTNYINITTNWNLKNNKREEKYQKSTIRRQLGGRKKTLLNVQSIGRHVIRVRESRNEFLNFFGYIHAKVLQQKPTIYTLG